MNTAHMTLRRQSGGWAACSGILADNAAGKARRRGGDRSGSRLSITP